MKNSSSVLDLLQKESPLKRSFDRSIGEESNTSMFNKSWPIIDDEPQVTFEKSGYEVVGKKNAGESSGVILGDIANKENQFLVKQDSIVTEFVGLVVYRQIVQILGVDIIVPECFLEKDDNNGKVGLFIKMIEGFIPNSLVKDRVHSAPGKSLRKRIGNSGGATTQVPSSYYDLVRMMVISMLIGDNDCSPDNSGSKNSSPVRLDLGQAFYWIYTQDSDFKQKLQDYFRAFYSEREPFRKFIHEFQALDGLLALREQENLDKIHSSLDIAIANLTTVITDQELQAMKFKNESISVTGTRNVVERKYKSFEELRVVFAEMLNRNIAMLPAFLDAVKAEIAALDLKELDNSFGSMDCSPPRDYQVNSSSALRSVGAATLSSPSNVSRFDFGDVLKVSPIHSKNLFKTFKRDEDFERG